MKNFALIGAAGFIAPRHFKAIKDTGNNLLAALDKHDNVGLLDSYFPDADFFTEFERFDRHLDKLRRKGIPVDFISICSPNYLHDSHIRFALRMGANAVCEKPLVLNPWNLEALRQIEMETGRRVFTILQLRLHPDIIALRDRILRDPSKKVHDVELTYITSRGRWYAHSWKGDLAKSGGIATNIGIHFFDMLCWLFGHVKSSVVHVQKEDRSAGFMEFDRARVKWFLSINAETLPTAARNANNRTYRSIRIEGEEIEFSSGFTDLHTESYKKIIAGDGFGIDDASRSIQIAYEIRNAQPVGTIGDYHTFAKPS